MPAYQTTPFKASPALLMAGTPCYVFGSFDDKSSPTTGPVISTLGVTTTATLVFRVLSGNAPTAGELITVVGTTRDTGNFNVTNATILTATTTDDGISTVTYAKASGSVGVAADAGQVIIPRIEVGEALVNGATVPVNVAFAQTIQDQGKTVNATVRFTGSPTTATATLQGAIFDIDAEYEDLGIIANAGSPTSGPTLEVADSAYRFYRVKFSNVVGGSSPKAVAKITV